MPRDDDGNAIEPSPIQPQVPLQYAQDPAVPRSRTLLSELAPDVPYMAQTLEAERQRAESMAEAARERGIFVYAASAIGRPQDWQLHEIDAWSTSAYRLAMTVSRYLRDGVSCNVRMMGPEQLGIAVSCRNAATPHVSVTARLYIPGEDVHVAPHFAVDHPHMLEHMFVGPYTTARGVCDLFARFVALDLTHVVHV